MQQVAKWHADAGQLRDAEAIMLKWKGEGMKS